MNVLGLNGSNRLSTQDALPGWSGHDAAAVIVTNGQILAAIEEERLDRIKHSNHFPLLAIRECLRLAEIRPEDLDLVALNIERTSSDELDPTNLRATVSALLQRYVGDVRNAKLCFVNHQVAHLFSAYVPSGFQECLCLSLDGIGDGASGAVGLGRDGRIQVLREFTPAQSLGELYCDMIRPLGYARFDEYKVMALAALGTNRAFAELFKKLYRLQDNGNFEIVGAGIRRQALSDFGPAQRRLPGEPFTQAHFDYAASLQAMVTDLVFHIIQRYREVTGLRRLAFAGGVAHNCAVNGRILESGLFDDVFVQPAAHDAGGALGAAIAVSHSEGIHFTGGSLGKLGGNHVSLGRPLPNVSSLTRELARWEGLITFDAPADALTQVTRELERGAVIGWAQGRAEFGPRALGNRSILADPRRADIRKRINRDIKHREPYRPFAPAILQEEVWSVFERPRTEACLDHMTFLLTMKPELRALFPAVVHADGTARVQTVRRHTNPPFHALLMKFHQLTQVPLLLNTSFNAQGEPIVDTIDDAIACFLRTGLDLLMVDSFLVRAVPGALDEKTFSRLIVSLPHSRKIVWRSVPGQVSDDRQFFIETTFSRHLGGGSWPIRADVAHMLIAADGLATVEQLCVASDAPATDVQVTCRDLRLLWLSGHVRVSVP